MPNAHDLPEVQRGVPIKADEWNALVRLAKFDRRVPPGGSPLTPFELYDDITPGDTNKEAWRLKEDGGDLVRDEDADRVQVSDEVLKDARAYGTSHSGITDGARGFYTVGANGKNQIVSIQRLAKLIRGSGPSSAVAGGASYTLDYPVSLDDGQLPGSTVTVTNYSTGLPANATNVTVVADGAGGYRTLDGPCP